MIGTICIIFPVETFDSCLDKTPESLRNIFYEADRQIAREQLRQMRAMIVVKSAEAYKELSEDLELKAYPPDFEPEKNMDKNDILRLRDFFAGQPKQVGEKPFFQMEQ
jgi:hypothetical protein